MAIERWTDDRLDDAFERVHDELQALRSDMNEQFSGIRTEMRELRSDFNALSRILIQVGFGMVGVLVAALVALVIAVA